MFEFIISKFELFLNYFAGHQAKPDESKSENYDE